MVHVRLNFQILKILIFNFSEMVQLCTEGNIG